MSRRVWSEAKHQLCWWHIREVLKKRLKGNLPTTPYNATRAKCEYHFIDLKFKPHGQADPKDSEGSVPDEAHESYAAVNKANEPELTNKDPNSICIRIPIIPAPTHHDKPKQTPEVEQPPPLTIWIPTLASLRVDIGNSTKNESDDEEHGRHTFC